MTDERRPECVTACSRCGGPAFRHTDGNLEALTDCEADAERARLLDRIATLEAQLVEQDRRAEGARTHLLAILGRGRANAE